jgi:hypothetical protein
MCHQIIAGIGDFNLGGTFVPQIQERLICRFAGEELKPCHA